MLYSLRHQFGSAIPGVCYSKVPVTAENDHVTAASGHRTVILGHHWQFGQQTTAILPPPQVGRFDLIWLFHQCPTFNDTKT